MSDAIDNIATASADHVDPVTSVGGNDTIDLNHETVAALDAVLAHAAASASTPDEDAARALASLEVPQIHGQGHGQLQGQEQTQTQTQTQANDFDAFGLENGGDDITVSSSNIDPALGSQGGMGMDDGGAVVVKTEAEDIAFDQAAALRRQNGFGGIGMGGIGMSGYDTSSSRGSDRFSMIRGLSNVGGGMGAIGGGGGVGGGGGSRRDGLDGNVVGGQTMTSSERYGARKRKLGPDGIAIDDGEELDEGYIDEERRGELDPETNITGGHPYAHVPQTSSTRSPHPQSSTSNATPGATSFQVPAPPTTRSKRSATAAAAAAAAASASGGPPPSKRRGTSAVVDNSNRSSLSAGQEGVVIASGVGVNNATSTNNNNNNNNMQVGSNGNVEPWWNNQAWDENRQDGQGGGGGNAGSRGSLGGNGVGIGGAGGGNYGPGGGNEGGMQQNSSAYPGDSPATGTSASSSSYMPTGGVYPSDPSNYNQWAGTPNGNEMNVDSDVWKNYYGGDGSGSGATPGGGGVGVNTENLEQYLLEPMSNNGTLNTLADPNSHHAGSPDDGRERDSNSSSGSRSESGRMGGPRSGIPDDLRDSLSNQPYSRSPELRVSHKLAERKRRREMKDLFDELRDCLPNDRAMKASKWEILSKSVDFIQNMKKHNESMGRELEVLRRENERMRLEGGSGGNGNAQHGNNNNNIGGGGGGGGNGNTLGGGGGGGGAGGNYPRGPQHQYPMPGPPPPPMPTTPNNVPAGGFVPPLQVQPKSSPFPAPATTLSAA